MEKTVIVKVKPLKTGWVVTKTEDGVEEQHGIQDFGMVVMMLLEWLPRKDEFVLQILREDLQDPTDGRLT